MLPAFREHSFGYQSERVRAVVAGSVIAYYPLLPVSVQQFQAAVEPVCLSERPFGEELGRDVEVERIGKDLTVSLLSNVEQPRETGTSIADPAQLSNGEVAYEEMSDVAEARVNVCGIDRFTLKCGPPSVAMGKIEAADTRNDSPATTFEGAGQLEQPA
nr:hypothetical protein GCM10025732_56860 [Glycomyces mayteni]